MHKIPILEKMGDTLDHKCSGPQMLDCFAKNRDVSEMPDVKHIYGLT